MKYVLFYETVDDFIKLRAPFREEHLYLVNKAHEDGELLIGGALCEPADTALLVFNEREQAEKFASIDPYVKEKLIKKWYVRPWVVMVGL
ncbi:YciI family protein [Flammeovirga agarivorans]|uniref:YCII-related domain-containing protein n=1 Tax=Flammeovirga agarivorans TaxID=2726742 RepID=A0A7X8SKB3_9BACT|nr:YciI family protein [Flammeovirga agarivorans]NLR91791.1 hypothetical protein [Flammeovirga agarivorans]